MKFGLMFVNVGPFGLPDHLENLGRCAEEAGIESAFTVEHVVVPKDYQSEYPYSPTGKMPGDETAPIPDPLLPLAFLAAVTEKLRLGTGVMILPQRHPAYVAKQVATLDNLSGGRAILGVGIGWLKEEFDALEIPFSERAARTEESVRAVRSLWGSETSSFDGKFYRWGALESYPKPVQPGGVPILVGGHVEGAARRAARVRDGFFPARGGDLQELSQLFAAMRDECGKIGRDPSEIEITVGALPKDVDTVRRYEELGVARMVMPPPAFDKEGIRSGLLGFAERVISKL
ncbi:MAG: LLM class F420-dependent oxidoreductase [Myxococcota bacterium]